MKKVVEKEHWYFVDESGDPTFYDRNGNLIVGQEGCSPIFILGFIETDNPHPKKERFLEILFMPTKMNFMIT
jgi:hypothetical protein